VAPRVEATLFGPDGQQYAGQGQARITIGEIAQRAALLESMGIDGVTTAEAGRDPFLPIMAAAASTSRIVMGTNVSIAFPRSPMVTAQLAWDLQHLTDGRFTLGLGTQVKGHNELRYSTPWPGAPGPRMREHLLCLRAIVKSSRTLPTSRTSRGNTTASRCCRPSSTLGPSTTRTSRCTWQP